MTASYNLSLLGSNYNQGGSGAVARTTASKLQESVSVLDFGAVGDGVTDDTVAIQTALNSAGINATILFPSGYTYLINPILNPTYQNYGGIKPLTGQTLVMYGATLQAKPVTSESSTVINIWNVANVTILGGAVIGERAGHIGTTGEWGMGISLWTAANIRIQDVSVSACWGDNIFIGNRPLFSGEYSTDVWVRNCSLTSARRNGISVVAGQRVNIFSNKIYSISGTSPQGGIDLEPNYSAYPNTDIIIQDNNIYDAEVALYVTVANTNVKIANNNLQGRAYSIIIGDNAKIIFINENTLSSNTGYVASNGGLCFLPTSAATIDRVNIVGNIFDGQSGGGFFLLDFPSTGATNVNVNNNQFYCAVANNRAVRLFCSGEFKNNQIVYAGTSGVNNNYFMILQNAVLGGNTYTNSTTNAMYSNLTNCTQTLPEYYLSSNLTAGSLTGQTGIVNQIGNVNTNGKYSITGAGVQNVFTYVANGLYIVMASDTSNNATTSTALVSGGNVYELYDSAGVFTWGVSAGVITVNAGGRSLVVSVLRLN